MSDNKHCSFVHFTHHFLAKFKVTLLLVLTMTVTTTGLSQPNKLSRVFDSLWVAVRNTTNDTEKIKLLCLLAKQYPYYDPNKGVETAREALKLSIKLHFTKGQAQALMHIGINEVSRTHLDSARWYFGEAYRIANEEQFLHIKANALKQIGISWYDENNYPEALKYFFDALSISEAIPDNAEAGAELEYIGIVYEAQKEYGKALGYYQKSYRLASAANEQKAEGRNLINIGQIYHLTNESDKALDCFRKALVVFQKKNDESGIAFVYAGMGLVYTRQERYLEAIAMTNAAQVIYDRYADVYNLCGLYVNLAKIYLPLAAKKQTESLPDSLSNPNRNLKKAFAYLELAEELCTRLDNQEILSAIYEEKARAHELNGNHPMALHYYKAFVKARDSVFSEERKIQISNMEAIRLVTQKDGELKLKQLDLMKRRNENIYLMAGLLLLLVIVIILFWQAKTQRRLNAQITEMVRTQEKTIEERTATLKNTNTRLLELVQFSTHVIREPITRIKSLYMMKASTSPQEFEDVFNPMIEEAINDLDHRLKDIIKNAEQP